MIAKEKNKEGQFWSAWRSNFKWYNQSKASHKVTFEQKPEEGKKVILVDKKIPGRRITFWGRHYAFLPFYA